MKSAETPFILHIRDPSGNSFVENPMAPKEDPKLTIAKFKRTLEEMKMLGLVADDATELPEEPTPVGKERKKTRKKMNQKESNKNTDKQNQTEAQTNKLKHRQTNCSTDKQTAAQTNKLKHRQTN